MASHASAAKAHRQSLKRRAVNRANLSTLRTELKRFRETVASGDLDAARKLLPGTLSIIDRSIRKKILHRNAAARQKSRLTVLLARSASAR